MPFSTILFAATIAAIHSFALADETTITVAPPTPTLARRGDIADGKATPIMSTIAFAYTDLPQLAYPYPFIRGPQSGYNDCPKEGDKPDAKCQTLVVNSLSDFCVWGSPETAANGSIGADEAGVVAYCTQPGHGARVIKPGMITSAQFIKTSAYIQITGRIKNEGINLASSGDTGGELDPHGADLQGNPIGGLVYSNGTTDSTGGTLAQTMNWNLFIGNGEFCVKLCYNTVPNPDYCQNRYDTVGCAVNMPNSAPDNEFTECDGDLQDPAGTYTGADGKTSTWAPGEDPPATFTPRVPSSSNCKTHASTDLFAAQPTGNPTGGSQTTGGQTTPTGGSQTTGGQTTPTGGSSTTKSGSSGSPTGNPGSGFVVDIPLTGLFAAIGFVMLGGRLL